MKKNQITDDLLVKYLAGEASETEKENVQAWISEGIDNKNHFNDLKLIWNQSRNTTAHTDVSADEAWERFNQRTKQAPVNKNTVTLSPSSRWIKIAAIFLLLAGGAGFVYFISRQDNIVQVDNVARSAMNVPVKAEPVKDTPANNTLPAENDANKSIAAVNKGNAELKKTTQQKAIAASSQQKMYLKSSRNEAEDRAKKFVCNSTPCPIEICIVQTIKCQDSKPAIISTCSTIAPDEAGQLHYTAFDKMSKNCASSVSEITIKRVSTGETIVLTANSKPVTAQEVFNYITGQKRGDITAGIFHADCYNNDNEGGIILDNKFGDLRLQ